MASVIITGATGTAGSAILTNALSNPLISHVTVLARRAPAAKSDKLTTILLPSAEYPRGFESLPPSLVARLAGADAVIWALGVSQLQVNKEEYNKITYDYTVEAARAFAPLGTDARPFRFVFVSGMGADQTQKSSTLFARVKGHAEADLVAAETGSFKTVNLRPGGIMPNKDSAKNFNIFSRGALAAMGAVLPGRMIASDQLAVDAVALAAGKGWDRRDSEHVVDNTALLKMAKDYASATAPH